MPANTTIARNTETIHYTFDFVSPLGDFVIEHTLRLLKDLAELLAKTKPQYHSDRLRNHPGLVQGWESVCWGVLGIPLLENKKVLVL